MTAQPVPAPDRRGSGLGLRVCHAIAQSHGGTLCIVNRAGGGTGVEVRLPLEAQPQGCEAAP